ncbi:NADH dehydrogenase subunit J [Ohtaekwangia koreensis]|uniref:NADH-quinone oxidoreductase subunit J n=2 Tax=Ohtaekwangia koreensis TaxID=688867 RepID=A0A1T5IZ33_9BACT|nr:NADH-quinone oxidoreductase subunit J [Ohtaekwangia koreensis]SKC44456.1 NADH dehydrogenase subunit J [Ohtaekwangia koreensis]
MTLNLFYFLSFLAIMSAIMVVLSKNPVYSVLYLIITFFCIAGHYMLMNAQFLAIVHIIVYAGAIMVLFLYVIMLLNLNKESEPHKSTLQKIAATICAGLVMIVLVGSLKGTEGMIQQQPAAADIGLVKALGQVMFTKFLLPFEITSVLLLAAMVGAVMLGKPEKR